MLIDVADLQWWQALLGIITLLGLSPAPWILGLANGKIQFTKPAEAQFQARIDEKDKTQAAAITELVKHHEEIRRLDAENYKEMKSSRDGYRDATAEQRQRADKATEVAVRAVEAVNTTNHVLNSLDQVFKEKDKDKEVS